MAVVTEQSNLVRGWRIHAIDALAGSARGSKERRAAAPFTIGLIHLLSENYISLEYVREQWWYLKRQLTDFGRVYDTEIVEIGIIEVEGVPQYWVKVKPEKVEVLRRFPNSFRGIQVDYEVV